MGVRTARVDLDPTTSLSVVLHPLQPHARHPQLPKQRIPLHRPTSSSFGSIRVLVLSASTFSVSHSAICATCSGGSLSRSSGARSSGLDARTLSPRSSHTKPATGRSTERYSCWCSCSMASMTAQMTSTLASRAAAPSVTSWRSRWRLRRPGWRLGFACCECRAQQSLFPPLHTLKQQLLHPIPRPPPTQPNEATKHAPLLGGGCASSSATTRPSPWIRPSSSVMRCRSAASAGRSGARGSSLGSRRSSSGARRCSWMWARKASASVNSRSSNCHSCLGVNVCGVWVWVCWVCGCVCVCVGGGGGDTHTHHLTDRCC